MRLMSMVPACAAMLLFSPVALAQTAPADAVAKPANEKIICRSQLATGSLTRRTRSCRTARDWADLRAQTREQIEKMQVVGRKDE